MAGRSGKLIGVAQYTIQDITDIIKSDTEPVETDDFRLIIGMMWLDTRTNNLYTWNGAEWKMVNDWSNAVEDLDKIIQMNSKSGTGFYSGDGKETILHHNLNAIPTIYTADCMSNPDGALGEVWVRADKNNLYVGNTGSFRGQFHWFCMFQSGTEDNPSGTANYTGDGGVTKIAHGLGTRPSMYSSIPIENPDGSLGDTFIYCDDENIYVGNTGSFTGQFHWHVIR